ncbi:hypothetical protein GGU10DRAFT_387075 [Lentinula aff. detonsa]|uniref:Uncharacterized protein n=1 Tax=Lentinula aff. detonsa TaxID=2804958 RepID=A0AA38KQU0_9AGAR|nr:hypothetical protein GGU10DRAFT_387075 [Lentinula aff. detonsa]
MLELRKKQAQEVFQEQLNILQFYNKEDVRKRIDQVKQDIKELEISIIPALREILASSKSSFSMGDLLESKFDELYIDLRQLAFKLGISPESLVSPGIEGLAFTPGHNQGTTFNDDTIMDTFVNWDGGIPDCANTELNVYHPFTTLPRLPSCVPLSPFTFTPPDGALMDFTTPRSSSEPNSRISIKNPTTTQENEVNKGSVIPEYIAHLYNKREQVTKLREENEHAAEVILELRNQVSSFESLSGARRKMLGRVKAQLEFVQSPDPARREWFDAARAITDRIIGCEIIPILENSEKEVRNQLVRKVEEKRPGMTITANQNLTDSGLSRSSGNDLPSGSGNRVQQQVWYQTWRPVARVRKG